MLPRRVETVAFGFATIVFKVAIKHLPQRALGASVASQLAQFAQIRSAALRTGASLEEVSLAKSCVGNRAAPWGQKSLWSLESST